MTNRSEFDETEYDLHRLAPSWFRWRRVLLVAVGVSVLGAVGLELAQAGRVYPGVVVNGVAVGGLSREAAATKLADQFRTFQQQELPIKYGNRLVRIPVANLNITYDTAKATDLAYKYGRTGNAGERLHQRLRGLTGHATMVTAYHYDAERLTPYLSDIVDDVVTPVGNAALSFANGQSQVTPAVTGRRVDLGRLVLAVQDHLARADATAVSAPLYDIAPAVTTAALEQTSSRADVYLSAPIMLTYADTSETIDLATISSWVDVGRTRGHDFWQTLSIDDLYPPVADTTLGLDRTAVTNYVAAMAHKLDRAPLNAQLAMVNNQLSVAVPSRNGTTLDQAATVAGITAAVTKPADQREVALNLKVTQPDVNETNLEQLGIKEQLSEGQTFFPGSTSARLTNVRAGASKFNNVLLKPGQVFSFGALLGAVGPETGYQPELVILGDHEEKQYGGGLCQVSSTAFRAALLAGLPILERHNHSFAVSYYTAPYGVPGVDATIYYPQVDFKFKNDTDHYILMQTVMQGSSLKFDFFGTKNKTGVIRGPQFVSGTNDATQPSHTVFYRDVLDTSGAVVKTDTFNTYYKSSKDFPIQKQFN